MRQRLQLCCILFAWLAATGSQWDAVQVFAWARMMTSYVQTMPLAQAAELTFDADKPCSLCNAVKSAKQQQEAATAPDGRADQKVALIYQPSAWYFFSSSEAVHWSRHESITLSVGRLAPPTPPPRGIFAVS